MTLLVQCRSISKSFGSRSLFTDITIGFFEGDRIGLIGPNGSGKSTLMKIIAGEESPDTGEIIRRGFVRIAYVPQLFLAVPEGGDGSVLEAILARIDQKDPNEALLSAQKNLSLCGFSDHSVKASTLSGGWRRRLDIASGLANNPHLLLLDEPTNHLDIDSIIWLESLLRSRVKSFVIISHDRVFLEKTANRTVELNRRYPKGFFEANTSFSSFLEKREEFFEAQMNRQASLTSRVRKEIAWLRQGAKARTTKQQARIKEAEFLQEELKQLKTSNLKKEVDVEIGSSGVETRRLVVAKGIAKTHGGNKLFSSLDLLITPKTRLGLVGPNGSGKTTLLRILAGEETPDVGNIKFAPYLKITYFDQKRAKLPDNITIKQALGDGKEFVEFQGKPVHVNGWAKRFLFETDRLELPIGRLSGGERARLYIARLMLQPADILLLDEPTNDLDIETLEVLEETFDEYEGALILITHDRLFLDRVANSVLALGYPGENPYFADFAQYEEAKKALKTKPVETALPQQAAKPKAKKSLSYREQQELDTLPQEIEKLEQEIESLSQQMTSSGANLHSLCEQATKLQEKVTFLYSRWETLEHKSQS